MLRFPLAARIMERMRAGGGAATAVRSILAEGIPPGVARIRVDADGCTVEVGPPLRLVDAAAITEVGVVIDSALSTQVLAGSRADGVEVAPGGVGLLRAHVTSSGRCRVRVGDEVVTLDGLVDLVPSGRLRLRSSTCARSSVVDEDARAWFPAGALAKWDVHGRPFFHGEIVEVDVPAGSCDITVTSGIGFGPDGRQVQVVAGGTTEVELEPVVRFRPDHGWFGGDLHVHLNYSGDLVCTPDQARTMQCGEGLDLMNLVAGNCLTSLIYDRELFEATVGEVLWHDHGHVAAMGVEYRNDLLGHVHALGPGVLPQRYATGHLRSDEPHDWPPNSEEIARFQSSGATVGYCHPSMQPFPDDWSTDRFFAHPRSNEARELVADAALGLVDSIDVISPSNDEGAAFLFHRLLSCGLRLAATAGTDTFLSYSHTWTFSNPPGWGRVYTDLGDEPLSVDAFKAAIRAGPTMVTNGPWLRLSVNGRGPGTELAVHDGDVLQVEVTALGTGVDELVVVGPDGVVARSAGPDLSCEVIVDGSTWIAAIARGQGDDTVLDTATLAHTSPVFALVDGAPVARKRDAEWCLAFLDGVQALAEAHGHFSLHGRASELGDLTAVLDQARGHYRAVAARARR